MREIRLTAWSPAIATLACLFAGLAQAAGGLYEFELRKLERDIYLLYRPDVLRDPVEPNALVIVNEHDVVVVEPGGTPLAAENAIRLIRSVTPKPVSVVVNTHWHGDHVLGNQVYRQEYPGVRIVAHTNTRRAITGKPMEYLGRVDRLIEKMIAEWEPQAAAGTLAPADAKMLPDLKLALAEGRRTVVTPPDLTFADELVLHRGEREIHVRYLGRGNTDGDAIVWLPKERIVATGDLVVAPIPYGFGSYPQEWIETLEKIAALDFRLLMPGHGEVQKDRRHLRLVQELLREVRRQVAVAVEQGLDLEATRKAVDLSKFERRIAGDDAQTRALFNDWWKRPIVRSAWLEARNEPILQGNPEKKN
jgi:cyclase